MTSYPLVQSTPVTLPKFPLRQTYPQTTPAPKPKQLELSDMILLGAVGLGMFLAAWVSL